MKKRRADREAELAADREKELQRRRDEETAKKRARQDERARKMREEEKYVIIHHSLTKNLCFVQRGAGRGSRTRQAILTSHY